MGPTSSSFLHKSDSQISGFSPNFLIFEAMKSSRSREQSNTSKLKMMRSRNNGHNPSLIKVEKEFRRNAKYLHRLSAAREYSGEASSRLRTYSLSSGYRGGGSSSASQTSSPDEAHTHMKNIAAKLKKLTEEMRQDRAEFARTLAEYEVKVQGVNRLRAEFTWCQAVYEGKARETNKQDVVKNQDEIQLLKNSLEELDKRILDLQHTVNALQLDIATMKMNNFFPGSIPWSKFPELC